MDIKGLLEIIHETANIKPKDITLNKLSVCLNTINEHKIPDEGAEWDTFWKISYQYYSVLRELSNTWMTEQKKENAVSDALFNPQNQSDFISTVDVVRQFTLHLYLPAELRELTKNEAQLMVKVEEQERVRRLTYCVAEIQNLFLNKMLTNNPRMLDTAIDFIAGVVSVTNGSILTNLKSIALPKDVVFKSLLMIKGARGLANHLSYVVHRDLLHLTGEPGGIHILCRSLLTAESGNDKAPEWYKSEVIAKIVATKGHTKKFYRQVLTDCFELYRWAISASTENALIYANTCLECFKQFYQLPVSYHELHKRIETFFFDGLQQLATPGELIKGFVLMEKSQLLTNLYQCHMAFVASSVTSLPSSVLKPYIALFLSLYEILPQATREQLFLKDLVIFYLANRSKEELQKEILLIATEYSNKSTEYYLLHPRILVKYTETGNDYTVQVGSEMRSLREERKMLPVLVEMLKLANHNILIYDIFVILLSELLTSTQSNIAPDANVLTDAEDFNKRVYENFYYKCVLIQSLEDLISHKNFHNQFYDNPQEILNVLESLIMHVTQESDTEEKLQSADCSSSDILDVVLSILQNFLINISDLQKVEKLVKLLQRYQSSVGCSEHMKKKIDYICNNSQRSKESLDSTYQNAISLCTDNEPYCKVYGTTLLLKLLKDNDVEAITNRHNVLILALENLRCTESYAFLNSVRLLVALCGVFESNTVDTLLKEYLNVDNDLDYRLKIGEATVKVLETLGSYAICYRDELLNCFLAGTHNHVDEFRTSSLSNIGNVCRILSYQVHHFFYELFDRISTIVETDKYLPARRAAIYVLVQLIQGMENLMDFQEYLLPIYRFLKHVIATDKDDVTKLQAAIALESLTAKTHDLLQIDPAKLERQMFGRVVEK